MLTCPSSTGWHFNTSNTWPGANQELLYGVSTTMGGFEPITFHSESDNTNHCATEAAHGFAATCKSTSLLPLMVTPGVVGGLFYNEIAKSVG